MRTWSRWFKYAKAKLDSTVRSGERELDRRETELGAEQAEKPWLRGDAGTPSYEDVRARIEADPISGGRRWAVRRGPSGEEVRGR